MENSASPSIFKTTSLNASQPTPTSPAKNNGNFFRSNLVKIIIAVLVIAVVGELIFGAYTLFSPSQGRNLNPLAQKANEMRSAQLSLVTDKTSYKKGDNVVVDVKLFTGGYVTDSSDLVVKYDPAFLSASGANFAVKGEIYSEYPAIQVDETNGMIGISGITLPNESGFSGAGTFATLNFTALKDGQTQLMIDYQPSETADSNVVLSGTTQDIIGAVVNADIIISEAGSAAVDNTQKCESFTQSCQNAEGVSGTQVCSAGSISDGVCGYDPKMTISCEACKI